MNFGLMGDTRTLSPVTRSCRTTLWELSPEIAFPADKDFHYR